MNHVDSAFKSPVILSFCPGILGLERGLERAIGPVRVAAYCEIEAFVCENLVAGMEAGILAPAPIWTDVKTFDGRPFRGKIHGILGGYPCQPFSTAGKRGGEDDPRHLWPHIAGIVDAVRPLWCFFENVSGHLTLGFDQVYQSLSAMGYRVEAGIFTAEEVGAPHQRERLFILAVADTRSSAWRQGVARGIGDTAGKIGLQREGKEVTGGLEQCGEKMANPIGNGAGTDPGGLTGQGQTNEGEAQWKEWNELQRKRSGADTWDSGTNVAYAQGIGDSGRSAAICKQNGGSDRCLHTEFIHPGDRWPAGPGQLQYEWESPRTIESGLGCRINGYSFREDILRALGNSVVEQQAELAFRILYEKHFSEHFLNRITN